MGRHVSSVGRSPAGYKTSTRFHTKRSRKNQKTQARRVIHTADAHIVFECKSTGSYSGSLGNNITLAIKRLNEARMRFKVYNGETLLGTIIVVDTVHALGAALEADALGRHFTYRSNGSATHPVLDDSDAFADGVILKGGSE
jgi:hypothetical protein